MGSEEPQGKHPGLAVCPRCAGSVGPATWLRGVKNVQMEDIRVELKVQQRLGQVPSIKLPEHRVVQLAKERESLIQEIHRLEAQQRDRVEQRQRLSARHGNQSETQ